MSKSMPTSSTIAHRNLENEKKYKKALRFIYKYGQDTNKLTDEAIEACRRQNIEIDDL